MKKVAIVHILPVENYPPVMNMVRYLSGSFKIDCITTYSNYFKRFQIQNTNFKRYKILKGNSIFRLLGYLSFYMRTFLFLLSTKPKEVIYYETLSALPVWLYRFFYRDVRVFIHYHEYVSPREYKNGMIINKLVHYHVEKKNYQKASWISQTNNLRKDLFCKDHNLRKSLIHIFPNYPPLSWKNNSNPSNSEIFKIVFVGYSVEKSGNYIEELIHWLVKQDQKIQLNFYLVNKGSFPKDLYKLSLNLRITVNDAIHYDDLPLVLKQHQVGLILYKPTSENWIYNAPNKLFEYLASGLDVWFPIGMIGTLPYENFEVYPKVKSLDFKKLDTINFKELISREGLIKQTSEYFCENVYDKLKKEILK